MKRRRNVLDPRETLAGKLADAGIDAQKAFFIALDAGLNLVNKTYLVDLGLKGERLKAAENIVKEFYWEDDSPD